MTQYKPSWYKRKHDIELEAFIGLTMEQRGVLASVLHLICVKADQLRDDDAYISRQIDCDIRTWRRLKRTLIEAGKLVAIGGLMRNPQLATDIAEGVASYEKTMRTGQRSGGDRPTSPMRIVGGSKA